MHVKLYDDLRGRIKLLAKDTKEYLHFCNLVTAHFNGRMTLDAMPESLRLAIHQWEQEQIGH